MRDLLQDIRFALRTFARRPVFTAVALLTLVLGIGATTAIFSVVNGVLLSPFPYPDSDRLVVFRNLNERLQEEDRMAAQDFFEFERSATSFSGMTLLAGATGTITGDDLPPLRVDGGMVSANFFDVLGIQPLMGRTFRAEENQGQHRVIVLSHALWRGRFAGDPDLVGKGITLDGETVQVVGVMPRVSLPTGGSRLYLPGPDQQIYWMPLDYTVNWISETRAHVMAVLARMHPEVSQAQAQDEMSVLARVLEQRGGPSGLGVVVRSLKEQVVGDIRQNLVILMAAVGLLLLMASGNLANLLLGRAADRKKELALRTALGAGRLRLVRQILTEVLLLASVGGLVGLGMARWASSALLSLVPSSLPRQSEVGVDGTVFLFTVCTILLATLVAGLVPSLQAAGGQAGDGLREGARGAISGRGQARTSRFIVISQLGLAAILLVGAGLLFRSFQALRRVDLGFSTEQMLTAQLMLPDARYADPGQAVGFFDRLEEQVASLPGVTSVVLAMDHPLENTWWNGISFPNRPRPADGEFPSGTFRPVSHGYFSALGIPVLRGREFDSGDGYDRHGVMVVNQAFVQRYFPDENVLGEQVRFTVPRFIWGNEANTLFEVVGVVGDVRFDGLREAPKPAFYIPMGQFPYQSVRVMVGTSGDPDGLTAALQAEVWSLDPDLPITDVRSLDGLLATELAQDRFNALLLGAFALAALILAAAGIYGVLSHAVSQRTNEMGVRMAMGAHPASVMSLVVREAGLMAGLGLAAGLLASAALSRFLAALLFGVPPNDPMILVGVGLVLGLVAVAACLVPAVRAARTDPMEALRAE
jgi:putative ABC transport system permease protein